MAGVDTLREIPLFAGLTDQDLAGLAGSLGRRVFGRGVVIFHEGSPGETMYIIESGRIRIFVLSESGQEISINVYGPGDVFGELSVLDGLPRSAGAVALEDTVTLTLHRGDLLRYLEAHPPVAMSIIKVLSTRLRYTTTYAEGLAFLDVTGRVAAKLLELGERYGVVTDGVEIALSLTQGELASWVGSSRETVNKVLAELQERGLIDVRGRRITLLDRLGLRQLVIY